MKLLLNGVKISIRKNFLDNVNAQKSSNDKIFIATYKKNFLAIGRLFKNDFYPKEVFDLLD